GVGLHPLSEAAVAPQVDQAVAAVLLAVEFISVVAAQVFPFQFQAPGVVGGAVGQGGVAQVAGRPGQVVAGEVAGGGAADVAEVPVVLAAVAEGQGGGPALGPAGVQAQFDTPVAGFPGVEGLAGAVADKVDDVVPHGHLVEGAVVAEPGGQLAPQAELTAHRGHRFEGGGIWHRATPEQLPGGGGAEGVAVVGVQVVVVTQVVNQAELWAPLTEGDPLVLRAIVAGGKGQRG